MYLFIFVFTSSNTIYIKCYVVVSFFDKIFLFFNLFCKFTKFIMIRFSFFDDKVFFFFFFV